MSDTDGVGTFPAKPYDFTGEYGPAATDVRQRFSLNGSFNTKWNVRLSPLLIVDSGPPFDITVGRDLYGTTLFNGRPGIPTYLDKPGLIRTSYSFLDPNPKADEKILPRNFGRGPGSITLNLRVSKSVDFGGARESAATTKRGSVGGGERRPATGAGRPPQGGPPTAQTGGRYCSGHQHGLQHWGISRFWRKVGDIETGAFLIVGSARIAFI
jgi:hypothetical protein